LREADGPLRVAALREVIEPLHIPGAGIRIASELGWITGELRPFDR